MTEELRMGLTLTASMSDALPTNVVSVSLSGLRLVEAVPLPAHDTPSTERTMSASLPLGRERNAGTRF